MTDYQRVFTEIYEKNIWGSQESRSGTGSDLANTGNIIRELPILFNDFDIKSILDIPCGDFNYFKNIPIQDREYIGADIVKELIEENNKKYSSSSVKFLHMDVIQSSLPQVDLILCRDCFIHFPNEKIKEALRNIKKSKSKFLLTTSHNWRGVSNNKDIEFGNWRRINLELPPFNLTSPIRTVFEGSGRKLDADRFLCLWDIETIPDF